MKILTFSLGISLLFSGALPAQMSVNNNGTAPHASAGLEVSFSDKGFLPPRLTASQISLLPSPAQGLILYNLTEKIPSYYDGAAWRNFDGKKSFLACGDPVKKIHLAGSVAPVNKTVIYGTVTGIPGEPSKCWITSNLGADHQADSATDASEASAGWYWQFGKKQGFKYDASRTPASSWINAIDTNSNWLASADPCIIELGIPWRLPTQTEWTNIDAAESWTTMAGPWSSLLKLHGGGQLNNSNGVVNYRGTDGRYWSSVQGPLTSNGYLLRFNATTSYIDAAYPKSYGCSVRCIRE